MTYRLKANIVSPKTKLIKVLLYSIQMYFYLYLVSHVLVNFLSVAKGVKVTCPLEINKVLILSYCIIKSPCPHWRMLITFKTNTQHKHVTFLWLSEKCVFSLKLFIVTNNSQLSKQGWLHSYSSNDTFTTAVFFFHFRKHHFA